jgi:hypothetical protein
MIDIEMKEDENYKSIIQNVTCSIRNKDIIA